MDIKIVEAYLKRVIKAADEMYSAVYSDETLDDAIIWNMQHAAKQSKIAKSLFVSAANEFNNQKTPHEIYAKEDQKYYDEMYGNV